MAIHPLAVVDSNAQLGSDVTIGPFAVIEGDVTIGDRCTIDTFAVIKRGTTLGSDNHVFEHATLGGLPQHAQMPPVVGRLIIGDGNTMRENVTIHRSMFADGVTSVGDRNLLMVGTHIAHDCVVENNTVFANNATLGGHVTVEEHAYLSGSVAVHQHCRIGRLTMLGVRSRIIQDVPPFVTIDGGTSCVVGLNTVGLRRRGHTTDEITQLKTAYRVIYRSVLRWQEIVDRLRTEFVIEPAAHFARFMDRTTRGIVQERRIPRGAVVPMSDEESDDDTDEPMFRVHAG